MALSGAGAGAGAGAGQDANGAAATQLAGLAGLTAAAGGAAAADTPQTVNAVRRMLLERIYASICNGVQRQHNAGQPAQAHLQQVLSRLARALESCAHDLARHSLTAAT